MNIMYLSLYGVAAVVLAVVFIRTCLERDKMTRIVCLTEMLALICVVAYSVNFITDNYRAMSVATSIMMAAQDFALVALLTYTGVFTRLANRITRTAVALCIFAAMVDSVVFIINIFNETALKYSLNKCGGVYVLGYEGDNSSEYHKRANFPENIEFSGISLYSDKSIRHHKNTRNFNGN